MSAMRCNSECDEGQVASRFGRELQQIFSYYGAAARCAPAVIQPKTQPLA